MTAVPPIKSLVLLTSMGSTIPNFRGVLISLLIANDVRVYAFAPDYDARTREQVRELGATPIDLSLERTGMRPLRDAWDAIRLVRELRRVRPDAILTYFAKPVIYGSLSAWLAGVPHRYALIAGIGYVFTERGTPNSWRRRVLRIVVMLMYKAALSRCARVFFQNPDDMAMFLGRRLVAPDKAVRVNGTGVDLRKLLPARPVARPLIFLLMARLLREKGICEFVEAARLVREHDHTTRFIVLGSVDANPGSLRREEVEVWVRDGIIEWPGHVDDVRPWIAQSSVYVLPSYYREGVPRSTQEAMAMGRPVITTDAVGCRETVVDGVNGFLVPVRNAAALAAAMLKFVRQPELIEPMGRASRQLAEQRFDIERISAAMLNVMGIGAPRGGF